MYVYIIHMQNTYMNVNTNHPIIYNSQNYYLYRKYISIHSQDRDTTKYPNSSAFEIELPQDYLNVHSLTIFNWSFPANYDTFSSLRNNTTMTFQINKPYNPSQSIPLQSAVYEALSSNINNNYTVEITRGTYTYPQMVTELTNKFNYAVTKYIIEYFQTNGYEALIPNYFYNEFVITYNDVKKNIWFGNKSSGFILTNSTQILDNKNRLKADCRYGGNTLPDDSNYGLPIYLGLNSLDETSNPVDNLNDIRFYYETENDGYWIQPNPLTDSTVYFVEAPNKANLLFNNYFYMELAGYNCIDETSPYNFSKFTIVTNQTNGVVDASFMKFAIESPPVSQWFNSNYTTNFPYKYFNPPAERIRKLSVRLRYHDGTLVDFGKFNYSFTLEMSLLSAQINKKVNLIHEY